MGAAFDAVVHRWRAGRPATSDWLNAAAVDHVVLERDRVGERCRSHQWDSLTLVTANRMAALPGSPPRTIPAGSPPR